jgi:hypothetical protein
MRATPYSNKIWIHANQLSTKEVPMLVTENREIQPSKN